MEKHSGVISVPAMEWYVLPSAEQIAEDLEILVKAGLAHHTQ